MLNLQRESRENTFRMLYKELSSDDPHAPRVKRAIDHHNIISFQEFQPWD